MEHLHQPVLVSEVLSVLIRDPDGLYVDGTVGAGGHSQAIGEALGAGGRLICLDRDPNAVALSRERLKFLGKRACILQGNFADLDAVFRKLRLEVADGVLLDLGMSSDQLERSGRGFSFQRDEPLDMRMDPRTRVTAGDLVNHATPQDLENILRTYGEEKRAKAITKRIVAARKLGPIDSSRQLARLIVSVVPQSVLAGAKHPATKTFQALRIAVNGELESLKRFLEIIPALVARSGRLAILAYHSLEDRLVKRAMIEWDRGCTCPPDLPACACGKRPIFRRLTRKATRPGEKEREDNPRARSAVLRVAERI